ncbi:MAG: sulfide/dihydroorotate dehydrogenase-like FAD/NAD-binding protein [Deltaproteobacteria bacterium]
MFPIIEKRVLAPCIHLLILEAPLIARKAMAGQFVIIRVTEKGERIPLTIADYDREKGTITLVFQEAGKTTQDLAKLNAGDQLLDLLGPQGNPTEAGNFGTVIVIGGGIGVAPVYPLARELKEKGNDVISIVGFRSKDHVFWEDRMKSVSDELIVCTNDGSYGRQGFVTDALKVLINVRKISRVYAIGPGIMMKAVAELTRPKAIKTIVSLNSLMVCGMGMCGACRAEVGGKTRFTCMEGPDFDAHQVDFDLLMKRLETYKKEECSCRTGSVPK